MEDSSRQPEGARQPEQSPETAGEPVERQAKPLYLGLPTGTGLGKYRILERLWSTHNAIVYKARDATLDRLVTVKQMSPTLIDNPIACGLFKREAQFLARVPKDARHVVNIHELIEDDLGLFIVEEYVHGHWLESLIAKRQTDLYAAIRVLKTAAAGLRTLHTLHLMHRGVHPGNIISSRSNNAKIANLATAAHEGDLTPPPTILPKYCAPELLKGGTYDDRIDIYSLGMSIYEMCVGRRELHECLGYSPENPTAAVDFWMRWPLNPQANLPEAAELNPLIPPALSSIIRRMTAKRLDERFASIHEVLEALARHLGTSAEHGGLRQMLPFGSPAPSRTLPGGSLQGYVFEARTTGALLPIYNTAAAPQLPPPATTRHTIRQKIQSPAQPQPVLEAAPAEIAKPATLPRRPVRRPQPIWKPLPRPAQPETIPAPVQVSEVHRRHPRMVAWIISAAIFLGAAGAGTVTLWYYHARSSETQASQLLFDEGETAYQQGDYETARRKYNDVIQTPRTSELQGQIRDRAECRLQMTEARLALARSEYDEALRYSRQAEKRGVNSAEVADFQQLCWARKDASRLEAEGNKALEQGRLKEAELTLEQYKQRAQASGLDSSKLEVRLEQSKADQKFDEAMKRAKQAIEQSEFEQAGMAVADAERIRTTNDTRKLRQQIRTGKERKDWIEQGDNAMEEKLFAEAATAYEKANQIEATAEIEKKARTAGALLLIQKAQEALDKGDLLTAERHLQSSLWKSPTQQAQTRLDKLTPAFDAARLVRQADQEHDRGNFAEAERLYREALPALPAPADAAAQAKLLETRQEHAVRQGDQAFERGDWQEALEAYQRASSLGRGGDVTAKIEAAKAKLQQ